MTGMVHKSLWLSLGQSFEHITLYTYNGAAIFFGAVPIYGVLLYSIIPYSIIIHAVSHPSLPLEWHATNCYLMILIRVSLSKFHTSELNGEKCLICLSTHTAYVLCSKHLTIATIDNTWRSRDWKCCNLLILQVTKKHLKKWRTM